MARCEGPPPRPTVPPRPWNSVIFTPASLHTWTGRPATSPWLLSAVAFHCMWTVMQEVFAASQCAAKKLAMILPLLLPPHSCTDPACS